MRIIHKRRRRNPALTTADVQMIARREAKIVRLLARLPDDFRRELRIARVREDIDSIIRTAEKLHAATRERQVAKTVAKLARPRPQDRRLSAYRAAKTPDNPYPTRADVEAAHAARMQADAVSLEQLRASIRADAADLAPDAPTALG